MKQPEAIESALKELAQRAHRVDSPSPAQLERMSATLVVLPDSWGPPPASSAPKVAGPSLAQLSPSLGGAGKWLAASGFTLIGAAIVAGQLRGEVTEDRTPRLPAADALFVSPAAEAIAEPFKQNEPLATSADVSTVADPAGSEQPENGHERPAPRGKSPGAKLPVRAAREPATSALRAELAQVELVESALRRKQPNEALTLGASFKFKQLRHQATALRAIALCNSNKRKQGVRLAKKLLLKKSPFSRRITLACGK